MLDAVMITRNASLRLTYQYYHMQAAMDMDAIETTDIDTPA